MIVFGIDPGIATTGYGILDIDQKTTKLLDFGVITTSKEISQAQRLLELKTDLTKLLKKYKPEAVGIEQLLFYNNQKTAMNVSEARGVIVLCVKEYGLEPHTFSPPQVKSSITGSGKADKKQVQESVKRILNLEKLPTPDDAADAIAICLCCFNTLKINGIRDGI